MRALVSDLIERKDQFSSMDYIEQVKYLAYFFIKLTKDTVFTARNIKDYFDLADLPHPANVADLCNKLAQKQVFLISGKGYKFHRDAYQELENEFSQDKPKAKASKKLRDLLPKVALVDNRNFLNEAVLCYEIGAYRSAIVMTWLLVIDNLYEYILTHKLPEFNNALAPQNLKLKLVAVKEDFNEIKESKFIEVARSAKIISNDVGRF